MFLFSSAGLKNGASVHWKETLKIMTGEEAMTGKALTEYFEPLYEFLKEANREEVESTTSTDGQSTTSTEGESTTSTEGKSTTSTEGESTASIPVTNPTTTTEAPNSASSSELSILSLLTPLAIILCL